MSSQILPPHTPSAKHKSPGSRSETIAHQHAGFTLIELSIVLVVIGLIVGGVMVGQDLITAAKMRSQISMLEEINTAANTFRLKYNCLPGDCANARNFFSAAAQPERVTNGDGDKRILATNGPNWPGADITYAQWIGFDRSTPFIPEWNDFFDHLSAAGLFDHPQYDETTRNNNNPGMGYPRSPMYHDRGVVVGWEGAYSYSPAGHKFRLNAANYGTNTEYVGFGGMSFETAKQYDDKVDDGLPYTGTVIAMGTGHSTLRIYTHPSGNEARYCAPDNATNVYYTSATFPGAWVASFSNRCALSIKANF